MAERDKSQGFGFVYVDVKKLLEEARARVTTAESASPTDTTESTTTTATPAPATTPTPVETPAPTWPTPGAKVLNFNRDVDVVRPPLLPAPSTAAVNPSQALKQIRQSLDRLQALHHKLHAVLAELSQVTERDRKK
jgi:hypothetical protein